MKFVTIYELDRIASFQEGVCSFSCTLRECGGGDEDTAREAVLEQRTGQRGDLLHLHFTVPTFYLDSGLFVAWTVEDNHIDTPIGATCVEISCLRRTCHQPQTGQTSTVRKSSRVSGCLRRFRKLLGVLLRDFRLRGRTCSVSLQKGQTPCRPSPRP